MHELAILQSVVSIARREAARAGFARVVAIHLRVGAVSGVVPACLEELFPIAARGTAAEGAALAIARVPAAIRCADCGYEGPPEGAACPACGGESYTLVAGREFLVDSIEVE